MVSRRGRFVIAATAGLALIALASPHYRADIRILTHARDDASPHRLQAAVDVGVLAVSILVTWTQKLGG
jgi:hypothetical protein